jgi:D-alanyl-D-alanine carboxypeptidase
LAHSGDQIRQAGGAQLQQLLGRYPGADGMKTGFICASGFNLVATATRGGKQLIAVVLGAPSSSARAVKAAELLESGFTQNPLSWLTPALGQVDKLTPINADPPNLHDEVCGRHRKRPAAEDEEDEAGGESGGVDTPFSALLSSLRAPTPKGAALLSDFGAVTPTVVYTGPTRTPAQLANLSAIEAGPHHRKKAAAHTVAVKPADEKDTNDKVVHEKGADEKAQAGKATTDKKAGAHSLTPTSPSALAASPSPGLETKRDVDPPKKRHKTKSPSKPTAAQ